MNTTRLFVGSLDFNSNDQDLQAVFGEYGPLKSCKVIEDRDTGRSRGFGFVEYENEEDAKSAVLSLNGTQLGRRTINVNLAKERPSSGGAGRGPSRGHRDGGRPQRRSW